MWGATRLFCNDVNIYERFMNIMNVLKELSYNFYLRDLIFNSQERLCLDFYCHVGLCPYLSVSVKMKTWSHSVNSNAVDRGEFKCRRPGHAKILPFNMFLFGPGVFWQFNVVVNLEPVFAAILAQDWNFLQTKSEKNEPL